MKKYRGVRLLGLVAALIVLFLAPSFVLAQTSGTGGLTGTITDQTGGSVPNAKITATNAATGQARSVTSAADGSYRITFLPPGVYRVRFEATGFKPVEVASITVAVTETPILDSKLEVGTQTQEVTVQAEAQTIQTEGATLGAVVGTKTITDLPLVSRNYTNLLSLSAGANSTVINATDLGKGLPNNAVNGATTTSNNFQMDGASINNYSGPGSLAENGSFGGIGIPNPDAIQEFKIQTSAYDAGSGRNQGAIVNVVTKSGGNAFHGSAFEFFRNTSLNANTWVRQLNQQPRARLDQNQFGGTFGGPVKKDKIFFFTSFQETRQKNGIAGSGSGTVTLPPLGSLARGSCPLTATIMTQCDATAQAFAADVGNKFCLNAAQSTNATASGLLILGTNTRTGQNIMCPTGVTPGPAGANINVTSLRILQLPGPTGGYLIPSASSVSATPNAQGFVQNYIFTDPALYTEHQGVGNIDYVINSKNTFSGRYFYETDPQRLAFMGSTTLLPGAPSSFVFTNHESVAKLTTVLSNSMVNEVRFSYQRNVVQAKNLYPFTDNQVGIQPINNSFPILNQINTGIFTVGPYQFGDQDERTNSYGAAETLSWTHGKHTVRTGFEVQHDAWYWNFISLNEGTPSFQSFGDFLLGLPGCAPSLTAPGACGATAGFGPGATNGTFFSNVNAVGGASSRGTVGGLIHDWRATNYSAFVQDDIKLTPRLTVNLGLRWEFDGTVSDKFGGFSNIWITQLRTAPYPGTGCVYHGIPYGFDSTGATATAPCTAANFAGYAVPQNYGGQLPLPPGVPVNTNNTTNRVPTPKTAFAPRVGFAWQPFGNKLSVRGGFGYFYDRIPGGGIITSLEQNPPASVTVGLSNQANYFSTLVPQSSGALAQLYAPTSGLNAIPLDFQPRWASVVKNQVSVFTATALGENFGTPLLYKYNLNVEYEFLPRWVAEVGYVGSQGIHQRVGIPINVPTVVNPTLASGTQGQLVLPNGAVVNTSGPLVFPDGTVSTNTSTNAVLRSPFLGLASSYAPSNTEGNIKFNSLQGTLRKQFSHGLSFQAAYTYSRGFVSTYQNSPNQSLYAPSTDYRPHRLALNFSYDLPFGNHPGFVGKVTGGWNVSGVSIIQNGTPLTITDAGAAGTALGFGTTAQFCPGVGPGSILAHGSWSSMVGTTPANGTGFFSAPLTGGNSTAKATVANPCGSSGILFDQLPVLNTNGTIGTQATCGTCGTLFGNSTSGTFLGPGQNNWDLTVTKTTKVGGLRESATLQFRAEFFNAFNHPQYGNPAVALNSPATFGKITTITVNPRLIQFGLKYTF